MYRTTDTQAAPGNLAWMPLVLHSALANTDEDIDRNIESALQRDYIPYMELVGKHQGAVAVVGSGPSLKKNWRALEGFDGDIIACNAACQFLLGKGIVPKYMLCFDADPLMLEFITPHKDITYLLGSRCPPAAFDMLEGCRVVCWHAAGDTNVSELLTKHGKMEPMVIGGSAAVTRAMLLCPSMGYTTIHLYGADSSHADGDTHIRQSTTVERRMAIQCAGRTFQTSPWMAVQATDFQKLYPVMRDHLHIEVIVHGDGLLPHIAMWMGAKTDLENPAQKFAREWRFKFRNLWANL